MRGGWSFAVRLSSYVHLGRDVLSHRLPADNPTAAHCIYCSDVVAHLSVASKNWSNIVGVVCRTQPTSPSFRDFHLLYHRNWLSMDGSTAIRNTYCLMTNNSVLFIVDFVCKNASASSQPQPSPGGELKHLAYCPLN